MDILFDLSIHIYSRHMLFFINAQVCGLIRVEPLAVAYSVWLMSISAPSFCLGWAGGVGSESPETAGFL